MQPPTKARPEAYETSRRVTYILMALFAAVSLALCVYTFLRPGRQYFGRSLLFPLFLLLPLLMRAIKLQPCWRLMSMVYVFTLYAYSYGCVYGGFSTGNMVVDKISHFFSGAVFTIVGFCLYYLQVGKTPGGLGDKPVLAAGYALFFSAFVGVMWEVCEFTGFFITGNDSQNNATTGVVDTMQDLISCLIASALSVLAFLLWRKNRRIRLLTPAILEEFYDKNADAYRKA